MSAPEEIPGARSLDVRFAALATVQLPDRTGGIYEARRSIASLSFHLDLNGLTRGSHRLPLVLDLPAWLPPTVTVGPCSITHCLIFNLDVDWALDVAATVPVTVVPAVWNGPVFQNPVVLRTQPGWHPEVALDVTVASTAVVEGDEVRGTIALRTGHGAPFPGVDIALSQRVDVVFARRFDRAIASSTFVPASVLRPGGAVPFRLPMTRALITNQNGVVNLRSTLDLIVPGTANPTSVPLKVFPAGSSRPTPVAMSDLPTGTARMDAIARVVADRSGLRHGRWPTLAYGREGMVDVVVGDASRGATIHAVEHHRFPHLRLGLESRPRARFGMQASLAPTPLAPAWLVTASEQSLARPVLQAFVARLLSGPIPVHVELSDDHLSAWHAMGRDGGDDWVAIAVHARARARAIHDAIAALPFGAAPLEQGWRRAAGDEGAFLLPHLPAIAGVVRTARTLTGEERRGEFLLAADPAKRLVRVHAAFDHPVPDGAVHAITSGRSDAGLAPLRAAFTSLRVDDAKHFTATVAEVPADPRPLLELLGVFMDWHLFARGERTSVAPYR